MQKYAATQVWRRCVIILIYFVVTPTWVHLTVCVHFSFNIRAALPSEATWQPVETNILWLSAAGITMINL